MTQIMDLPEPLTRELLAEASREGISLTDHATLMLYIATALHDAGKAATPFQDAIKTFLASRSLDPHQISFVLDELLLFCARSPHAPGQLNDTLARWRETAVHNPSRTTTHSEELSQWPKGFFEETYGSESDSLIERLPQGEIQEREFGRARGLQLEDWEQS